VGLLRGVPTSSKGPRINHFFFANDSLFFCMASVSNWQVLTRILDAYEKALGQRLNKDKTSVFLVTTLKWGVVQNL
jgi:hypothetical protein